jgi:CNT family concentrative nucleoside transporter
VQERLTSALGAFALLAIAFALCPRALRAKVRPRTISIGLALLLTFALLVLRTPARRIFDLANDAVVGLLELSKHGAVFLFGKLVTDTEGIGFVFAFQVLPTIIFFAALMSVLYHVGILPFVVRVLGRSMSRSLGTSGAESFSTAADIFVGQTEAPLVIRPYVRTLTDSELFACMTAGFATTAGGVLAAYVVMLQAHVPGIAGHLLACSVMSAPAALVIAKLMLPESGEPATSGASPVLPARTTSGVLDAITQGTTDGLKLAVNVGAMLITFLALTALLDACIAWVSRALFGQAVDLARLLGWAFSPLAFLLGVEHADVPKVAMLLGQKTALNELVAYSTLSRELAADPAWLSERSRLIASYALCGFANLGSIGIQIGGYAGIAPERRADLARLGPRAMLAGLLTTSLVACVAGVLL